MEYTSDESPFAHESLEEEQRLTDSLTPTRNDAYSQTGAGEFIMHDQDNDFEWETPSYRHDYEDHHGSAGRWTSLEGREQVDAIRRSSSQQDVYPMIGAAERTQRELQVDEHGNAYVDMNKSGRLRLGPDAQGCVATGSLAGCTGVAGFARRRDGSTIQFVSHYDELSQNSYFTRQDSPINDHMVRFEIKATVALVGAPRADTLYYVVAYPTSIHHDLEYDKRQGDFKNWHYLNQIETTASRLDPRASILFLPYDGVNGSHTLAAGRNAAGEGIFWNGVRVDFENPETITDIEGAVLTRGGWPVV